MTGRVTLAGSVAVLGARLNDFATWVIMISLLLLMFGLLLVLCRPLVPLLLCRVLSPPSLDEAASPPSEFPHAVAKVGRRRGGCDTLRPPPRSDKAAAADSLGSDSFRID